MKIAQNRFENQVAVVTGSSRGLGKLTAEKFLKEGAKVVILAEKGNQLKATGQELKNLGEILVVKCDVRKVQEVKKTISATLAKFGRIDVLVNNAGIALSKPVLNTTETEWEKVISTNLKGVFLFSREVLPGMIAQKRGCIINISSKLGRRGMENYAALSASKFGIIGFTESLARELKNYKDIRLYAVCPSRMTATVSAPSLVAPEKVADLVLSLADRKCKIESGAIIDIP